MVDNTKLSFLPEDKGENVIKFNLREGNKENARAILYLPEGSKVIKHTHNEDSEVYVDILKIMQVINSDETLKGHTLTEALKIVEDYGCPAHVKNWFETLLASATKVAGQNSPTGDLGHEIAPSKNPQIYLQKPFFLLRSGAFRPRSADTFRKDAETVNAVFAR